jgi:phosphate:Na+ symporter
LPFTNIFAIFIKKIIYERKSVYLDDLDENLLKEPAFALNSLVKTLNKEFLDLLIYINILLSDETKSQKINIEELQIALDETQIYADKIHLINKSTAEWEHLISIIHIIDHLQRLHERCEEDEDKTGIAKESEELKNIVNELNDNISDIIEKINKREWIEASKISDDLTNSIQNQSYNYREEIAYKIATGEMTVPNGSRKLEAIKWLKRVSIHINRICLHLGKAVISTRSKYKD